MTETTAGLKVGDRVKLRPCHNWLSRYAPLAASERAGTITGFPSDRQAWVQFDVVKRGAAPIHETFARSDLIACNVPFVEQTEIAL